MLIGEFMSVVADNLLGDLDPLVLGRGVEWPLRGTVLSGLSAGGGQGGIGSSPLNSGIPSKAELWIS